MKTDTMKFIAAAVVLSLLTSCAQTGPLKNNDHTSMNTINTKTSGDHDRIARQYENAAREFFVKAEEHKKLLQHYEDKSYLYGRRGQDFQSHTEAILRKYTLAAEKAARHSAFHQHMAPKYERAGYAASGTPRQVSNR